MSYPVIGKPPVFPFVYDVIPVVVALKITPAPGTVLGVP